eukprot:jgi/Chlat1/5262/Chrsp33S00388
MERQHQGAPYPYYGPPPGPGHHAPSPYAAYPPANLWYPYHHCRPRPYWPPPYPSTPFAWHPPYAPYDYAASHSRWHASHGWYGGSHPPPPFQYYPYHDTAPVQQDHDPQSYTQTEAAEADPAAALAQQDDGGNANNNAHVDNTTDSEPAGPPAAESADFQPVAIDMSSLAQGLDDEEFELELTDEWAARFAATERRRRARRAERAGGGEAGSRGRRKSKGRKASTQDAPAGVAVGSAAQLDITDRQGKYSSGDLARVLAVEATLNARFDELCDSMRPKLWPCIPLRC